MKKHKRIEGMKMFVFASNLSTQARGYRGKKCIQPNFIEIFFWLIEFGEKVILESGG